MSRMRATVKSSDEFTSTSGGGITEIVLPSSQHSSMYLPSLAFLSRTNDSRWLTWVVGERIGKEELRQYGFDLGRTRFVYLDTFTDGFGVLIRALEKGNSHTVVGNPGRLTEVQLARLEAAAYEGRCHGLLLRGRNG